MKTLFYNSIELPAEVHIVSGLFLCYNFGETISKYGMNITDYLGLNYNDLTEEQKKILGSVDTM